MTGASPVTAFSLTPLERRTVEIIQSFVDQGIGPSFDDIAEALGTAKSSAKRLVDQLESKGWVTHMPFRARSITLLRRLDEKPGKALSDLLAVIFGAKPDGDYVHVTIPAGMFVEARAAYRQTKAA